MGKDDRAVLERREDIAILTLNRPDAHNALDASMVEAVHRALAALEGDADLSALVIQGAGEKAFAAGADIAELEERRSPDAFRRINQALFRRIEDFPAPTIAAVRGWALGGGCELALACDLRIAGESARFGQPEVSLGIIPGAGGTHRLARLVGLGKARELIFTGRIIDAQEAARIGLVNAVVAHEEVLSAALELAGRIAKNSRNAVRLAKQAINAGMGTGTSEDLIEVLSQAICFDSEDKMKRMARFLERKNQKK